MASPHLFERIVPALVMPPEKAESEVMIIAWPLAVASVPAVPLEMPPEKVSMLEPARERSPRGRLR